MVDGLLSADIETQAFVKANRSIGQMLGYSPEELLSLSVRSIHPPEHLPAVFEQFQSQVEGRLLRGESTPILRKDGSVFYADITASRIFYRGRPSLIGFFRDVSERRRATEAMRQALAQLETIYGEMIEGLLITDIETKRFVRANASFCRMLGYTEEEILTAAIKDIHPTEEIDNDERRFEAAADGRVSINEDRPVLRKDGTIFYADITGRRILYNDRPCLLALFRDITERKQAAERLKAEQQSLRRMVLANDHERQLITYELHDGVAQQLAGAKMLLESQQPPKGRKSAAAEAYRDGLEALQQAATEIRRVMNWLRTPVLDRFGLVDAIADVVTQWKATAGAPVIEYQHQVRFGRLDPTLENSLFRIAQEALTNACRHSRSEKVQVKLVQNDDELTLEVRDWGVGFEPQAIAANRYGVEGIRERSRILGGKCTLRTKPGEGTVIRVKVPVIEAAAAAPEADSSADGRTGPA
jgi:PAS domain S-box-containing protein